MRAVPLAGGAGVFLACLSLYLLTVAPGLTWSNYGSDGGDLLAAAHTWGVPHPSGYPTYLILLRLFSFLVPIGDAAFRGNLFSAAAGAVASALVYLAAYRLLGLTIVRLRTETTLRAALAAFAGLSCGTARALWSQSTITEVYALNALFSALLILVAVETVCNRQRWGWPTALGAFAFGLGVGNHLSLLAVGTPILLLAFHRGGSARFQSLATTLLPFALGLCVYAYLPIASSRLPSVNWGHPHSLAGFWWMISGEIYQAYLFIPRQDALLSRASHLAGVAGAQFTLVGLWLALAGGFVLWAACRPFVGVAATSVAALAVYALLYRTADSFLYLIPAFQVVSIWATVGLAWVALDLARRVAPPRGRIPFKVSMALAISAAALIPVFSVVTNFESMDLRDDRGAATYAGSAMDQAGRGGVILSLSADHVFALWYASYVARPEESVAIVSVPHLQFDWYWRDLRRSYPDQVPEIDPGSIASRIEAIVRHNNGGVRAHATTADAFFEAYDPQREGVLYRLQQP